MIEVDVVGGVFDGAIVETARYPTWGWVGAATDGEHRLWGAPGEGRQLYRLAAPIAGSSRVYLTAEHTHRVCDDCGCVTEIPGCVLCGAGQPA